VTFPVSVVHISRLYSSPLRSRKASIFAGPEGIPLMNVEPAIRYTAASSLRTRSMATTSRSNPYTIVRGTRTVSPGLKRCLANFEISFYQMIYGHVDFCSSRLAASTQFSRHVTQFDGPALCSGMPSTSENDETRR